MGQEASLPQANGDEFEEQARAPPSSVNPPPPTQPGRPGSKMIGAMLHRAAQNSNQQHQIFEGKESARAAAGSGQMPFVSGSSGGEQYGNGQQMMMQQQQYPPPNLQQMSPEEQQQYYQQQQMLMMQQQQQQQLLQQQQSQHQYYDPRQQPPPHGDTNVNVNMYGSAGKKSGRGKALINSMRNLSIGNTIRSGVQGAAHAAAATANAAVATATSATAAAKLPKRGGIQDWETRWDEDDSDEDEEGDEEVDTGAQAATAAAAMHHQQQQHHQQSQSPMRPGMDTGHPGMSSRGAEISTMASPPRKNMVAPIQEPAVQGVDDGLEWDTGVQQGVTQKPNVQMFLPLLRVLGKGSFGKV